MGPGDLCLCQGQWAVRSKPPLAFWDANKVLLLNRDLPPVEWRPPLRQEPRKTLGSHASPDGSGSASKEGVLGEPHSLPPGPKLGLSDRPRAWPSPLPSSPPSERGCCAAAGDMEPGRRTRNAFVGVLHASCTTTSEYFSQRKLDFHTSLNKNGFYF